MAGGRELFYFCGIIGGGFVSRILAFILQNQPHATAFFCFGASFSFFVLGADDVVGLSVVAGVSVAVGSFVVVGLPVVSGFGVAVGLSVVAGVFVVVG